MTPISLMLWTSAVGLALLIAMLVITVGVVIFQMLKD